MLKNNCVVTVGEEDEISIREAAEAIVESMDFTGQVIVSFKNYFISKLTQLTDPESKLIT